MDGDQAFPLSRRGSPNATLRRTNAEVSEIELTTENARQQTTLGSSSSVLELRSASSHKYLPAESIKTAIGMAEQSGTVCYDNGVGNSVCLNSLHSCNSVVTHGTVSFVSEQKGFLEIILVAMQLITINCSTP